MLDREARVFYVGTFSKSLFPALRKGFIVTPYWARAALIDVKHCADSHSDIVTQGLLADFIREGHLARHIRRMKAVYGPRRDALLEGLHRELAAGSTPSRRRRACTFWLRVLREAGAARLIAKARVACRASRRMRTTRCEAGCAPALTFGYGVIDAREIRPRWSVCASNCKANRTALRHHDRLWFKRIRGPSDRQRLGSPEHGIRH